MGRKPRKPPTHQDGLPVRKAFSITDTYDDDEEEFIRAVEEYRKKTGRRFPSWSEVLHIAKSLGYRKTTDDPPLCPLREADREAGHPPEGTPEEGVPPAAP